MRAYQVRQALAFVSAAILGTLVLWGASAPAAADIPVPPAAQFSAPPCAGSTDDDPQHAAGVVPDLTLVFGQRLIDYNAGLAVALYDTYGDNNNNGYPALCGVRHVNGVGPVSEWMFCTDYFSHICGGTDAAGNLLNFDGAPIAGLQSLTGNVKLTKDMSKIIAYLIQNGHSYNGVGYFSQSGETVARSDDNSNKRVALQTLLWCISDPPAAGAVGTEGERATTCANSMSPLEQSAILARIPDVPAVTLSLSPGGTALAVGDTATFSLSTNLYNQPIPLAVTGPDPVVVLSGPGTIAAGELTVAGTDPAVTTTVTLGITGSAVGSVSLEARALPASTLHLGWNQSPGISLDLKGCQVYATFNQSRQVALQAIASASFATASVTATLPATGARTPSASSAVLAFGLLVGGTALIVADGAVPSRRRRGQLVRGRHLAED